METGNYSAKYSPTYSQVFDFERNFDHAWVKQAVSEYWLGATFAACVTYLLAVFGIQRIMASKPRFELRPMLVAWNGGLAAFSIAGALRTIPEFMHMIQNHSVYESICVPSYWTDIVCGFWVSMFCFSKLPEFGDTIFIVLRKQPLIFLHWYHHMSTLVVCMYSHAEYAPQGRWYAVMNYSIHSIMYSYYALKAMRIRVSNKIAMLITTLQILQMVVGTAIAIMSMHYKHVQGLPCHVTDQNAIVSLVIYISYFFLFAQFFYGRYLAAPKLKPKTT